MCEHGRVALQSQSDSKSDHTFKSGVSTGLEENKAMLRATALVNTA